ncbi:MAG: hypothetical protein NVS3B26_02220 [Mycobacteriales bacterium]
MITASAAPIGSADERLWSAMSNGDACPGRASVNEQLDQGIAGSTLILDVRKVGVGCRLPALWAWRRAVKVGVSARE